MRQAIIIDGGATVFAYRVNGLERNDVVFMSKDGKPLRFVDKPSDDISNLAITSIYLYDHNVVSYAKFLRPSDRGELEITDLNNIYLEMGRLDVTMLGRGVAWLDTGKFDTLVEASQFVAVVE